MEFDLLEYVKTQLKQKLRDPSFTIPISIREPPVTSQYPGLIESKPSGLNSVGAFAAMGSQFGGGSLGGGGSPLGLPEPNGGSPEALMAAAQGQAQGAPSGFMQGPSTQRPQSPPPSPGELEALARERLKQQRQQPQQSFNPADALLTG